MIEQLPDLSGLEQIEVRAVSQDDVLDRVGRRRRRRRIRMAAGAGVLACAAAAIGLVGNSGDGSLSPEPVEAAARVVLPGGTVDTDLSAGHLWVLTCQGHCASGNPEATLVEVGSANGQIEKTLEVNGAQAVATGAGSTWVANFAASSVERIDPETGDVSATIPLTLPTPVAGSDARLLPTELAFGDGSLWVSGGRGYAAQIDPATNAVEATYGIPLNPGKLFVSGGSAWIGGGLAGVVRIDPSSGAVSEIPIEGAEGRRLNVSGLAEVGGELWAIGGWAEPITEAGEHAAYAATSESALVQVGAAGAESPAVPVPERLTILAGGHGRLLLARKPRAATIYEYRPGSSKIAVAARLKSGGALLESRGNDLWIGVAGRVLDLYKLGTAPPGVGGASR